MFCHCRWPCLAAMACSWSTSCTVHSCLLMLGCSQFCQNFRISSALRPPSNCRETSQWPPRTAAAGTRGGAPCLGAGLGQQTCRVALDAKPALQPPCGQRPRTRGEACDAAAGLVARACPTHVNVGNLRPVVAVQPAPQQGLLRELTAEARAAGQAGPLAPTHRRAAPTHHPAAPTHLISRISFSASLICFSRTCPSASVVTLLFFCCRYSSLQAGQRHWGHLGALRPAGPSGSTPRRAGYSPRHGALTGSLARIVTRNQLPAPSCLGVLTHREREDTPGRYSGHVGSQGSHVFPGVAG